MSQKKVLVTIDNLYKSYGSHPVIKGVSFDLQEGEIFGLLGPNGSGKTTILETIVGLRKITEGSIHVMGINVNKQAEDIHPYIGVQPQDVNLFSHLKVGETLRLFSSMYQHAKNTNVILKQIDLHDAIEHPTRKLSGGQRKRLAIGIALIANPDILFLDEPTAALDPHSRRNIWDIITTFKDEGKSVFLTTHSMEEAYTQCDRVAILHDGQFVAQDTPTHLIEQHSPLQTLIVKYHTPPDLDLFKDIGNIRSPSLEKQADGYELTIYATKISRELMSSLLQATSQNWQNIRIESGTLEDVFIELTGKKLSEGELIEQ